MSKRNILMLCYYFPPLTDVGAKRSVAFSSYFKKHGWDPYVISVKNPDKAYCSIGKDIPPPGVRVYYTHSMINLYWFVNNAFAATRKFLKLIGINLNINIFYEMLCIPDLFWGWIPLTAISGAKSIKEHNIDLIYVSCAPHSAALTGIILKKLTGKPLVLDYRDPFYISDDPYHVSAYRISGFRKKLNQKMQTYFLKAADLLIVNNYDTRDIYIDEYPLVKEKIFAVHNGFDAANLNFRKRPKFDKFTITYTGDYYFNLIASDLIFSAIEVLEKRGNINSDNFQFLFYGDDVTQINRLASEYGVQDFVIASTRVPYQEILDILSRSHLQLLRIVKPMISTKLFEGIPLDIPFLATIPKGEVENIIKEYSPSSYIITENSPDQIAQAIIDAMSKYDNNLIKGNRVSDYMDLFSRENLTIKLMDIIDKNL